MAEESKMIYEPLPDESAAHMQAQREYVETLIAQHIEGKSLAKSYSDFQLLQTILDAKVIPPSQTWELQSIGVVFGDALARKIDGLSWWQVTDEYGTDAVLRYKQTTLQIGAKTIISKRVEDGEEVDIEHIYLWLKDFVENKSNEYE